MWQRSYVIMLLLLARFLLFGLCVSCLPIELELSENWESSGNIIMLNDDAPHSDGSPAGKTGDTQSSYNKDELFESLAELLSRLGGKVLPERITEKNNQHTTEQEMDQETQPDIKQNLELDTEQDIGQNAEKQMRQDETQLETEYRMNRDQGAAAKSIEKNTENVDQVETDRPSESSTEMNNVVVTENLASAIPEPFVISVQLTGVPVVTVSSPKSNRESIGLEKNRDWNVRDGDEGIISAQASPERNEVPLPAPERRPIIEPIIIAETAPCLGCVTPILQDSSDLRRVANMAAKLLEDRLNSSFTFRVTEVYRASKQVVNGIKYFLTLEVASTSCRRPVPAFTLCYVAENAARSIYAVELLHQPHRANTELLSHREVAATELAQFSGLFAAAIAEPATVPPPSPLVPAAIAPGDSLLDILMDLDTVMTEQGRRPPLPKPLRVQALLEPAAAADRQPSSGQQQTDVDDELATLGCRAGRQYLTQEVPLNVAHPRVQKILHDFLESQELSRPERLVITNVKSATRQTITETNFRFEFVLGVSKCLKNSTAERYSCTATGSHQLSDCRVRARQRPDQPLQFNSVSCTTHRQPDCPAGQCSAAEIHPYGPAYLPYPEFAEKVNVLDPAYQQLVQHVQDEINRRSRKPYLKRHIETLNATKVTYHLQETSEIVQQELYSLTLRLADTLCERTAEGAAVCLQQAHRNSAASADDPTVTSICDVRVSSLGWADRMRVLDLFCETEDVRQRPLV